MIFLDMGCYDGDTIFRAIEDFPQCDRYIGIEPTNVFSICQKRLGHLSSEISNKVQLYNVAIDVLDVTGKFIDFYVDCQGAFIGTGSSCFGDADKFEKILKQGKGKKKKVSVKCLDACYFFESHFSDKDEVILKLDIEGKEYDVLEILLAKGYLERNVVKLFVEWHWNKVNSLTFERHKKVVGMLKDAGFNIIGKSRYDEYNY